MCIRDRSRVIKRIFNGKPEGKRKGRKTLRWSDGVSQNISTLGIRNWKNMAMSREEWRNRLKKARGHKALSSQ